MVAIKYNFQRISPKATFKFQQSRLTILVVLVGVIAAAGIYVLNYHGHISPFIAFVLSLLVLFISSYYTRNEKNIGQMELLIQFAVMNIFNLLYGLFDILYFSIVSLIILGSIMASTRQ